MLALLGPARLALPAGSVNDEGPTDALLAVLGIALVVTTCETCFEKKLSTFCSHLNER